MSQDENIAWIAADWGTSNLRVYAMDEAGQVLADKRSTKGMGTLARDEFEQALLELVWPWLSQDRVMPVMACGMVGARQGWIEAPYSAVPCPPSSVDRMIRAPVRDSRLEVMILPGLSQADPPDVMRGEETQIAGYLAGDPGFEGTLCLPGTHTKWVGVRDGRVERFRTAMTGEMIDLLSNRSVLRHSAGTFGDWDDAAFRAALDEMLADPGSLLAQLFSIRASALLNSDRAAVSRSRLIGRMVGAELAAMRAFWQGLPVVVIGTVGLGAFTVDALRHLGVESRAVDTVQVTLAGLFAAYRAYQGDKR
ncbi:2-keto-3-deoxy-galactonokinase [Hartmannibacter diazotrophicus]|uniref:2-keto-3-deoxy-galactonokinase n=1 Tax=Hartmannibacter diazotrophicus TaxID=1482074 RepID=A0A2C9DDB8_9HYPH|nr:2-dehydro-3-deoxygalactonokinase [Hartmannibacter diazotrophicus]SON58159.1 2-keto-3-deoxy-galactonokinase [Hartmannibacter diazotrophicus]